MSEKAPRSNPRLDNFEANKATHDQEAFEKAVYGNAGTTLFNDRARRRVEEGDAYERHMEAMAERDNSDPFLADLNGQENSAFERDQDEAIAENERFDGERAAREQEVSDKIASDPELRRAQMMANDIATLRNRTFDHTNADALVDRLKAKEDKLNELLEKYSERKDADPVVIDRIIDSTVAPAETSASETASNRPEVDTSWTDDDEEDERDVDASEVRRSDEAAAEVAVEREEVEESEAHDHVIDTSNRPEIDTSWADDDEEPAATDRPEVNTDWADDDEHEQRDDAGLDIVDGDNEEEAHERRGRQFSMFRNPWWRTHEIFTNTRNRIRDRREAREEEGKRGNGKMVAVAAGAIALAGAFAAYKLGAFDHLFGHHGSTGINPGDGGHGGNGGNGGTGGNGGAGTGENPGGTGGTTPEFPQAAYDVHNGEGWYETFQDMNIPHDEWADVLQKAGPQLHEHGWAYVMDNGQWGISRPGELPKEMLELIQHAADEVAANR